MKRLRGITGIKFLVYVGVLGLLMGGVSCKGRQQVPLRVVAVLPLTGGTAYIGEALMKGMRVAEEEINTSNKKLIEVRYEDSMNDPKIGVSIFHKFVQVEHYPVVISSMSGVTKALIPLADKNHVLLLATAASGKGIAASSPWVFRFFTKAEIDGKVMAKYAYDSLGLRRVGVLYVNNAFGQGYADVFAEAFRALGGTPILEAFDPSETNFRTYISKLLSQSVEALYLVAYSNNMAVIPRQIREMNSKVLILGPGTLGQQFVIDQAGGALEGAYFTDNTIDPQHPQTPEAKEFIQKFKEKFGKPPEYFEFFGYDILNLLYFSFQKAGAADAAKMRDALLSIRDYSGAVGNICVRVDGEVDFPVVVRKVVNGRPSEYLYKWVPTCK